MLFFRNYWMSIAITGLILYLSFTRNDAFKEGNILPISDKTAHYLLYVFYGIILIFEYLQSNNRKWSGSAFWSICIVFPIVFGGAIELMQEAFFKPRSAEWLDWLCDIAGVFTAYLLMKFGYRYLPFTKR